MVSWSMRLVIRRPLTFWKARDGVARSLAVAAVVTAGDRSPRTRRRCFMSRIWGLFSPNFMTSGRRCSRRWDSSCRWWFACWAWTFPCVRVAVVVRVVICPGGRRPGARGGCRGAARGCSAARGGRLRGGGVGVRVRRWSVGTVLPGVCPDLLVVVFVVLGVRVLALTMALVVPGVRVRVLAVALVVTRVRVRLLMAVVVPRLRVWVFVVALGGASCGGGWRWPGGWCGVSAYRKWIVRRSASVGGVRAAHGRARGLNRVRPAVSGGLGVRRSRAPVPCGVRPVHGWAPVLPVLLYVLVMPVLHGVSARVLYPPRSARRPPIR